MVKFHIIALVINILAAAWCFTGWCRFVYTERVGLTNFYGWLTVINALSAVGYVCMLVVGHV